MKRQNRLARARPAQVRANPAPLAAEERVLTVAEIGARGDGVLQTETGPLYVPYALPGEQVRARVAGDRAEILELLTPSADRQGAPCAHFGRCGGCQLQHWAEGPYLAWKRDLVVQALAKRGMQAEVEPVIPAWGEGRRRAGFHATRVNGAVKLGFLERGGTRLQPVQACPVLVPPLELALKQLLGVAELLTPARGEITLHCLWTETGLDVGVKGAGKAAGLSRPALERAAAAAELADLARLSLDGETVVERRMPRLRMGRAMVSPPPGSFLQPTALGEEILARLTLEALAGTNRVVDLFSGLGTFALRIAEHAEVLAAETDQTMLDALKRAADGAGGQLKKVDVLRRDLLRTPLSSLEMKKCDGAVMDPPRSGAKLQAEQVGRAGVRKLAYVSCDPAAFARDLRVLVDLGFHVTRITPVDQFRWSPHLELVAALER